jgi:hypothetical protein
VGPLQITAPSVVHWPELPAVLLEEDDEEPEDDEEEPEGAAAPVDGPETP